MTPKIHYKRSHIPPLFHQAKRLSKVLFQEIKWMLWWTVFLVRTETYKYNVDRKTTVIRQHDNITNSCSCTYIKCTACIHLYVRVSKLHDLTVEKKSRKTAAKFKNPNNSDVYLVICLKVSRKYFHSSSVYKVFWHSYLNLPGWGI